MSPPFPAPVVIAVDKKHESCGKEQISQSLLVSSDGFLQNAVVSLEGTFDGAHFAEPAATPVLDQKNCHFAPHILLVSKNQTFQVSNSDSMAHDVRIFDGAEMFIRFEMDAFAPPVEKKIEKNGRFVIRCGLHKWMHAFAIVTEHPFYAVTDDRGRFRIAGVPAGKYRFRIWHEKLGEAEKEVDLVAPVHDFAFTFPPIDKGA